MARTLSRRRQVSELAAWGTAWAAGLGGLAGCAPPGMDQPPEQRGQAPATLRYLHWWPSITRFGAFEAWRTAFREAWPNVDVVMEEISLGEFNTKFQVMLSSGTAPDVVLQNSHAQTRWYDAGAHLDVGPLLARDKINLRRDYALMGTELWCEKTYALPVHADPNAIFYNKTLLQQAGIADPWESGLVDRGEWTLDAMAEMGRRVSQDLDRDGTLDQGGFWMSYSRTSYIGQIAWTMGGDVTDFRQMRYILDSPISLQAHQRFYDWVVTDRSALTGADASRLAQGATGRDAFSAGKVAFRNRAVPDVATYRDTIGDAFEWDILPFPGLGSGRPGAPLVAGDPNSVVKEIKEPELAYQFAKLIATARGQDVVAQKLSLPALKSKQAAYLKQYTPPAHVKVFADVYTKPYGIHFRHHLTNDSWAIYAKTMGQILAGEAPLTGALQEANRLMNESVQYGDCQPYQGISHPIRP
ncbi:MAG: extracellular solute-binding protein [Chloroflexota bacterium]